MALEQKTDISALLAEILPVIYLDYSQGYQRLAPGRGQLYYVDLERMPFDYRNNYGPAVGIEPFGKFTLICKNNLGLMFPRPAEVLQKIPDEYLSQACAYEAVNYYATHIEKEEQSEIGLNVKLYRWCPIPVPEVKRLAYCGNNPVYCIVQSIMYQVKNCLKNSSLRYRYPLELKFHHRHDLEEDCFVISEVIKTGFILSRKTTKIPLFIIYPYCSSNEAIRFKLSGPGYSEIYPYLRWLAGSIGAKLPLYQ